MEAGRASAFSPPRIPGAQAHTPGSVCVPAHRRLHPCCSPLLTGLPAPLCLADAPPAFRLTPLPASSMPLRPSAQTVAAHRPLHALLLCPQLPSARLVPQLGGELPGRGLASPLWEVRAQVGMQAHGLGDSELLGAKSGPWGLIPALPPAGPQSPHL